TWKELFKLHTLSSSHLSIGIESLEVGYQTESETRDTMLASKRSAWIELSVSGWC
ncbi:Hypothetical predicted protein, partial [Olea europaea subsp. europaea]